MNALELLEFVFQDFWHYIGTLLFVLVGSKWFKERINAFTKRVIFIFSGIFDVIKRRRNH